MMVMTESEQPVRKSVTVGAPIEKAFRVFTDGFDAWWPRSHHIGEADIKQAVLETRDGGRWYEIGIDGSECEWGRVLSWEPPNRVVLAWQIDGAWHYNADFVTEVEVRFTAEGPDMTRVDLEHRNLDRLAADERDAFRASISSEGGWGGLLVRFADAAAA